MTKPKKKTKARELGTPKVDQDKVTLDNEIALAERDVAWMEKRVKRCEDRTDKAKARLASLRSARARLGD